MIIKLNRVLLFFILCSSLFCLYACKKEHTHVSLPERENLYSGLKIGVVSRSGQKFENAEYLSLPMNHCSMHNKVGDSLDFLVISLPVQSDSLHVLPLAIFKTIESEMVRQFILAIPEDKNLSMLPEMDFDDFMIKYNGIRLIIDTWFSTYKGLGKVRVQDWQDGKVAQQTINDFLSIVPEKFEQ